MPDTSDFVFKCDNCDFLLTAIDNHTITYIQPCPECLDEELEKGREEGHDDGQVDGHKEGYDEGFSNGWEEGNIEGYQEAEEEFAHGANYKGRL